MLARELFHSLTPADAGKTYWVTNFQLNHKDPFRKYESNIVPVQAVIPHFDALLTIANSHPVEECNMHNRRCRAYTFQTLKKNGQLAAKTIASHTGYYHNHDVHVFETEEEALDAYENLVAEGLLKMQEEYDARTEPARNSLNAVRRRKASRQ